MGYQVKPYGDHFIVVDDNNKFQCSATTKEEAYQDKYELEHQAS